MGMGPCFRRRSRVDFRPLGPTPPRSVHASGPVAGLLAGTGERQKPLRSPARLHPVRPMIQTTWPATGWKLSGASRAPGFRPGQSPSPVPAVSTGPGDRLRSGAPARGSDRPNRGMTRSRSTDPRRRFGAWYRGASPCDRDEADYEGGGRGWGKLTRRFFFTLPLQSSSSALSRGSDGGLRGLSGKGSATARLTLGSSPRVTRKSGIGPPDSRFEGRI